MKEGPVNINISNLERKARNISPATLGLNISMTS